MYFVYLKISQFHEKAKTLVYFLANLIDRPMYSLLTTGSLCRLKETLCDENFINFENVINMKLYSILILNKIQKIEKTVKALKKTKLALFPTHILPCPTAPIACSTLGRRHQHVARCCGNIQLTFSRCLCMQIVCLGSRWIHKKREKYF